MQNMYTLKAVRHWQYPGTQGLHNVHYSAQVAVGAINLLHGDADGVWMRSLYRDNTVNNVASCSQP